MLIKRHFNLQNKQYKLLLVLLFLGIIHALIAGINHYCFRTYTWDYGYYLQILYDFAHFKSSHITTFNWGNAHPFGDHFSPIMYLWAPFTYLFGSYTLVFIQIAAFSLGGLGIYKYAQQKGLSENMSLLLIVQLLFSFGIIASLSFNFYNNTVAAAIVPWLFLYFERRNITNIVVCSILIAITRENMALWLVFLMLGLGLSGIVYKKDNRQWLTAAIALGALLYAAIIILIVMPWLAEGRSIQLERYSELGTGIRDILYNLVHKPRYIFALLFENPKAEVGLFGVKSEFYFMMLVSGGWLFFKRPLFLLMAMPIIAQKMFSSNPSMWGISMHYSVELMPLLSLALVDVAASYTKNKQKWLILAITILTILATISSLERRVSTDFNKTSCNFYIKKHYVNNVSREELLDAINVIPKDAPISATHRFGGRLGLRDKLYAFPDIQDAEYAIILKDDFWPFSNEEGMAKAKAMVDSGEFRLLYQSGSKDVLVLQKILR